MLSIASRSSGDGLDDGDVSSHSSSSGEGTSASTLQSPAEPTASVPNPSNFPSLQTPNNTKPHYPVPLLGPNDIIGKVILSGSKDGLDYGLVEITNDNIFATNQLFARKTLTEAPRFLDISSIGSLALKSPVHVLAATSSSGLLDRKLEPALTYIRLPGSTYLEKVYIGHFSGTLEKGDCGAVVVDFSSGSFYGHIIGGNPGTGTAYVVSGEAIFADLETRHGKKVTFSPLPASSMNEPAMSASDMKSMHTILMRKLSSSASQDTLRSMLLFVKDLIDCELVWASKYPEDKGFASAIAQFRSLEGAKEARDLLNGKRNASNDAPLIVEMVQDPPLMRNYASIRSAATMQSPAFSAMPLHTIPSTLNNLGLNPPCYHCGDTGHISRECTKDGGAAPVGGGGGQECYKCGKRGHIARNCTQGGGSYHQYQQHFTSPSYPPVNLADRNPPCNTLYVGNLPSDASADELKALFSKQDGYKRLCFRTKQNGPMCFVEFEDVSFATKALNALYGHPLHNSTKGGIRLSFSKNPLGVRTGQSTNMGPTAITPTTIIPTTITPTTITPPTIRNSGNGKASPIRSQPLAAGLATSVPCNDIGSVSGGCMPVRTLHYTPDS